MRSHVNVERMGLRVKTLRLQQGMSLDDVAKRAGCTKGHVWSIEKGQSRNPTIAMAAGLANALGTSLDYLVGLSTDKPRVSAELSAAITAVHEVAERAYERGKLAAMEAGDG